MYMALISTNPTTGETIREFTELTPEQIEAKLGLAESAFKEWRKLSFAERAEKIKKVAEVLRANTEKYGMIATQEMGKPIKEAKAEVEKCALVCDYYAENAEKFLSPENAPSDASESFVRFDAMGAVLAIMPWNFPYWQLFRFAAGTIMAGNVVVMKHASNVQGCAEAIEEAFKLAGFPEGVFQNLPIGAGAVEKIIRDKRIIGVTLTGSEKAGRAVAATAADEVKKSVLELGGSDPFIVLEDADIAAAAQAAATSRLLNCGQVCLAAKRFIVVESVAEKFLAKFKSAFENFKIGDPTDITTQMGPLMSAKAVEEIDKQVQASIAKGARLVTGGQKLDRAGAFYAPTILADINSSMLAYTEEIFGPVAAVITVKNEAEAIRVANDSDFGLSASLWTNDKERAKRLAAQIEVGSVFINGMVKSDPRLPLGGVKRSGFGRELYSFGIREFVNIKSVWIK